MTKRKSLMAAFSFVLVLSLALICGILLLGGTLTAYAEDSTSSDSEIPTHKVYLNQGTIQADGKTSTSTGRAIAELDVREGSEVTIIAQERSNAVFEQWTHSAIVNVTFADKNSATTTFVMPKGEVWVESKYKVIRSVTVENGTLEGGAASGNCTEGDTVKITAVAAPEGKEFDKWVVVSGGVTLADEYSATTTFVMPDGAVEIKATYKDKAPGGGEETPGTEPGTGNPGTEPGAATPGGETPGAGSPGGALPPAERKGLSGGAIAGIVIGAVVVVGIGGLAIFWFAIGKKILCRTDCRRQGSVPKEIKHTKTTTRAG